MTLQSGVRVGVYEVVALVGTGGMGEVYRARDTRLGRDVALKVLADALGADPDRLARLHREAQVLAALNHPNIAHIYGLEESDGQRALVLELVDGPTLAERIARGPIALDEAIAIAGQIVDALEAAHDQGIVHRDLKPANINLRPDGTVKVLDFGLAKAMTDESATLEKNESFHMRPSFLPDGRHFFYRSAGSGLGAIFLASLDSRGRSVAIPAPDASNVAYANGYLLLRDTMLSAQRFDLERLQTTREPVPLAEQVQTLANYAMFSASDTGVLAYAAGATGARAGEFQLTWRDRSGSAQPAVPRRDFYNDLTLSPDGTHASVSIGGSVTARDLWQVDLANGRSSRFTFERFRALESVWSPDGTRIVFNSTRNGHLDLFVKASSGAGNEEPLFADSQDKHPTSWSPDGRYLLYSTSESGGDIWVLPMVGDRKPYRFVQTPANEAQARFSPDGRWVAYSSNESGTPQVYVAPFPGPGGKQQISSERGSEPRWRRDGKELFYVAADNTVTAVEVTSSGDALRLGAEHALFTLPPSVPRSLYDVAPDGRFLAISLFEDRAAPQAVTILMNWPMLLKK